MLFDCDLISGQSLRPLFRESLLLRQFEERFRQIHQLPGEAVFRHRRVEGVQVTDWQKNGVNFSAGVRKKSLIFVSMTFAPGQLQAKQLFACLGAPQRYQAWYNLYPTIPMSTLLAAFLYLDQMLAAYGGLDWPEVSEQTPLIDDNLPVNMLLMLDRDWAEKERSSALSRPWPGNWDTLEINRPA